MNDQVTTSITDAIDKIEPESRSASLTGPIAIEKPDSDPGALHDFWQVVRRLPAYLRLVSALVRDPGIPNTAKASLAVGGLYAVSPVDLIPGIVPVLGQLDDLYVLLTSLQVAVRTSPQAAVNKHLEAVGIPRDQIDSDLATIRRLVRIGVQKTIKVGGEALASAGSRISSLVKHTITKRGNVANEQKSI